MSKAKMIGRRAVCASILATCAISAGTLASADHEMEASPVKVTCFIRYQIDPFQREAFQTYARNWLAIIPSAGGELIGYFLPYEGTNDIAWALISFVDLARYEKYRARLRADPEAVRNFVFAKEKRFILREERTFLENVSA